jgi:single-strand DNA-binding protein
MSGINKVILVGHLGKDPEIKYLEGNVAKVNFTMATSEVYKDKTGARAENTEWHNIVLWRAMAENAEKLLKKGTQIYLEGKIQSRQWTDRDGNKKNITEIIGEQFVVLQRKDPGAANSGNEAFESNSDLNLDSKGLPY